MQTPFVRRKPRTFLTWSLTFFEHHLPPHPPPRRGQESTVLGAPRAPTPRRQPSKAPHFRLSPLPQGSPFPGVSPYAGTPLPVIPPSRGSLSPVPRAHGLLGTHRPGYGAERGSIGGGSLVRQRAQNRPALPAQPAGPLAPEVTYTECGRRGPAPVSAHVRPFLDRQALSPHPVAETAPWGPEPGERVASRHRFRWHSWES